MFKNTWMRTLLMGLAFAGCAVHAAIPFGPVCDPTRQSCAAGTTPPPGGPGACGPGRAGATCATPGPATQGSGPGINVGAGNPLNVITGNKYQREVDMPALPGVLGLEIVRHYNSVFSSPTHSIGIVGRGWKLSYETDLYAVNRTIQIVQADGTRIIFNRDRQDPSHCASANPADGTVRIDKTGRGDEYTWTWTNGRQLNFNHQGKLVQILAPTGEFVSMQHDRTGMLLSVSDPQGRKLRLHYLDSNLAQAGDRFRGVQEIDSPVGRFTYGYGSALPKGASIDKIHLLANLVKVGLPGGTSNRIYHYEDARRPTLLTGISVIGPGSDGKLVQQRIATYGYDINGKGILTVKGTPARLQTGADGKALQPAALVVGTGIEQVTLDTSIGGRTIVSNSLGQKTIYRHAIVGGEFRLLDVRGAGCASCGEANVRYDYDSLGRLTGTTRLTLDGQPIETTHTELDADGRTVKVSRIGYPNGKPGPSQWLLRYAYAGGNPQPVLIARPSVVPGREFVTRISYNEKGQPLTVSESGWVPAFDGRLAVGAIERSTRYRYRVINNRSLLIEIDGPLPNGKTNSPSDSDITVIEYDNRSAAPVAPSTPTKPGTLAQYDQPLGILTRVIAPGNVITEIIERDEVMRPSKIRTIDGDMVQVATVHNNWRSQPIDIEIEAGSQRRKLGYRYNTGGQLTNVALPGNLTIGFQYDQAGRMTGRILPDGSRIVLQHDTEGRTNSVARYADFDVDVTIKNALFIVRYAYGANGDSPSRLTGIGDGQGSISAYRYDERGQIAAISNALGSVSQFDYDASGQLATRIDAANSPDAAAIRFAYDSHGHATRIIAANDVATLRRYDDFGRKTFEVDPDHGITLFRHDAAGRLIARIDETLSTTRYSYDHASRLIAVGADQEPNLVQYRYRGRQLSEVVSTLDGNPKHATERTEYQRDAMGQVIKETRWLANVAPRADAAGAASPGLSVVTTSDYDDAGRMVRQTLPDGHRLQYRYASAGDTADSLAPTRSKPGQLTAILFDEQSIVSDIEQTMVGGLSGYTTSNGIRQRIKLDGRGRIEHLTTAAPDQSALAQLWQGIKGWFGLDASAGHAAIYGQLNRYDPAGRLTAISRQLSGVPGNTDHPPVTREEIYGYDAMNRLTRIDAGRGTRTDLRYDKSGNRVAETVLPSTAGMLRAAALEASETGTRSYHYAPGSNRLLAITGGSQQAEPRTGGLPAAMAPKTPMEASDLIRNAWFYHATGVPLAQLSLALMRSGSTEGLRRTVYNRAKRPIAIYDSDGQLVARYHYNTLGERVAKTLYPRLPVTRSLTHQTALGQPRAQSVGTTSYSLYRDQRLAAEVDSDGRITAHYIYLNGKPVAKIEMDANTKLGHRVWTTITTLKGLLPHSDPDPDDSLARIYAIHTDHLGTPQVVTDSRREVVWQAETTPFGQARILYAAASTGSNKPFELNLRLPGQVFDAETRLNYNYFRDYDPNLGRYTTPDPLGLGGGLNPYAYAANNPATYTDPLGLYEIDVHYYTTFFLGITAGMNRDDARRMALATQFIDDNEGTRPVLPPKIGGKLDSIVVNQPALVRYHFTQDGFDPNRTVLEAVAHGISGGFGDLPSYIDRRINNPDNDQLRRLLAASDFAKTDPNANCNTSLQLFGEYLHTFEDSFAHRDQQNNPYSATLIGLGIGHALGNHDPDYTYNHFSTNVIGFGSWNNNEARTLEMEKEVFSKLKAFAKPQNQQNNWSSIAWTMTQFNQFNGNEEKRNLGPKIAILNDALKMLGYIGIDMSAAKADGYDVDKAKEYRGKALDSLNPKNYPGTIFPQGTAPIPE